MLTPFRFDRSNVSAATANAAHAALGMYHVAEREAVSAAARRSSRKQKLPQFYGNLVNNDAVLVAERCENPRVKRRAARPDVLVISDDESSTTYDHVPYSDSNCGDDDGDKTASHDSGTDTTPYASDDEDTIFAPYDDTDGSPVHSDAAHGNAAGSAYGVAMVQSPYPALKRPTPYPAFCRPSEATPVRAMLASAFEGLALEPVQPQQLQSQPEPQPQPQPQPDPQLPEPEPEPEPQQPEPRLAAEPDVPPRAKTALQLPADENAMAVELAEDMAQVLAAQDAMHYVSHGYKLVAGAYLRHFGVSVHTLAVVSSRFTQQLLYESNEARTAAVRSIEERPDGAAEAWAQLACPELVQYADDGSRVVVLWQYVSDDQVEFVRTHVLQQRQQQEECAVQCPPQQEECAVPQHPQQEECAVQQHPQQEEECEADRVLAAVHDAHIDVVWWYLERHCPNVINDDDTVDTAAIPKAVRDVISNRWCSAPTLTEAERTAVLDMLANMQDSVDIALFLRLQAPDALIRNANGSETVVTDFLGDVLLTDIREMLAKNGMQTYVRMQKCAEDYGPQMIAFLQQRYPSLMKETADGTEVLATSLSDTMYSEFMAFIGKPQPLAITGRIGRPPAKSTVPRSRSRSRAATITAPRRSGRTVRK
jgi:hypothetical protein